MSRDMHVYCGATTQRPFFAIYYEYRYEYHYSIRLVYPTSHIRYHSHTSKISPVQASVKLKER